MRFLRTAIHELIEKQIIIISKAKDCYFILNQLAYYINKFKYLITSSYVYNIRRNILGSRCLPQGKHREPSAKTVSSSVS